MFYNAFLIIFFYFATQLQPKPKREYEERLRAEVFRWQAPELFHGYEPYKESDVYGLALLIWEMCTSKYLIKLLLSLFSIILGNLSYLSNFLTHFNHTYNNLE